MNTFEHWYYSANYRDELDLIYTGWFVWVADEACEIVKELNSLR